MTFFAKVKNHKFAIIWVVVILLLCLWKFPASQNESGIFFKGFDKLVHLGLFFVLSVLFLFGKLQAQQNFAFTMSTIFKIVAVGVVLGGGIELLQKYIFTYRSAEWWDFVCDMLGIAMGIFSFVLLHFKTYSNEVEN